MRLDVKAARGGDTATVVEEAGRYLARSAGRREVGARLVLLDRDRVREDRRAGRDAQVVASKWNLQLIYQDPKLEGLLLRLHKGSERRRVAASTAETELRRVWPEYRKPPGVEQLSQRFTLADVRRAALYDEELQRLLTVLGL